MLRYLAATLPVVASLVLAGCGYGNEGEPYSDWAAAVCEAADEFAIEGSENSTLIENDLPRAVTVDAKREVFTTWLRRVRDSTDRMQSRLDAIPYPDGARTYHEALLREATEAAAHLNRALIEAAEAEGYEDLEYAYIALVGSIEAGDEAAYDASEDLPTGALAALNQHKNACGSLFP